MEFTRLCGGENLEISGNSLRLINPFHDSRH